jgi:hypothetical protein
MKACPPTRPRPPDLSGAVVRSGRYDPWQALQSEWPHIVVRIEPLAGDLLGEARSDEGVIALRAGTSPGQRRCTLTHEIVHLERGLADCGPWQAREELLVHAEVARRLLPLPLVASAIRQIGGDHDRAALAEQLDVDVETLQLRLRLLSRADQRQLRVLFESQAQLWSVA